MGMFDYKNYASEEISRLVIDVNRLTYYTNSPSASDNSASDTRFASIPEGWKELNASDLGVSDQLYDRSGYFKIESVYTGFTEGGPQAKIFGHYDSTGSLTRINLNFAGTNNPIDLLDYFNLNSREGVELFNPILNVVKDFAEANGLKGDRVVISGPSLGAALTNVVAAERESLADRFFVDADYIAFAVPTLYDNPDVVLNIGYENDVVHRITGNEANVLDAILAADPGLVNPDKDFASSTDNLVLFNDVYASRIWNVSAFSFVNILGWSAHDMSNDAIARVIDSSFYEETRIDSTVLVSELTALSRRTTWMQDYATPTSSHFGTSAFLVGSKYDDLIQGGANYDYIDGGLGNDTIRAGLGVDHVDGGSGHDELRVEGRSRDWDVYKMSDDTLFFLDKDGMNLVEADRVESVSFQDEWFSHTRQYDITNSGLQDNRFFRKWFGGGEKRFLDHEEGSSGEDTITGQTVFAREGNDWVIGTHTDDTLHGGRGDDVIIGLAGNDRIYGAEGHDIIDGGAGSDLLIGGVGNDIFMINSLSGNDVIADFNNDSGYKDLLQFSADLFTDDSALTHHVSQFGKDVLVALGNRSTLTVENCSVDDLLSCSVVV